MKSPNLTESKVAKYIKYGQVDLKSEEPRLTAAVYLRNLKKEASKKANIDKNLSERKLSKTSREWLNRMSQPKIVQSVQITKKMTKPIEHSSKGLLTSEIIRQPSKERLTAQQRVYHVKKVSLTMAKSKSPVNNNRPVLIQEASTSLGKEKGSRIPKVSRKHSNSRLNLRTSCESGRSRSPSGLKSPTPINSTAKKPSMFAKTRRAAGGDKSKKTNRDDDGERSKRNNSSK